MFLKTFNSHFSCVKVWFASQNFRPLEIEDKRNLTLVIISCVIYKMKFSIEPRD